jgi:phage terminase large subunit-like protein
MRAFKTGIEAQRRGGLATGYRALSAKPDSKHGLNPAVIIFDEVHTLRSRDLYDVLNTSTGAQAEPLEALITTAGDSRTTICWELQTRAEAIEAGALDAPDFLPILFRAPADADWTSPDTWVMANPSLGPAVRLEYLAEQCRAAQQTPARENTFRRLHLNQWTEQATRWIPMDKWRACAGPVAWGDLPARLAGLRCYAGLDLSTTTDLTALVLVFPPQDGLDHWAVVPKFFAPRDKAALRARRDRVPYPDWGRAGAMTLTDGEVVDYDIVAQAVIDAAGTYRLIRVAFDRYNSSMLVNRLMADGLPMMAMGQGYVSYAAPMREAEGLILNGEIHHGDHPVLSWNAANVAVDMDAAGNMKPAKDKSGDRIDGMAALLMGLAMAQMDRDGQSVYETRGVRVL